MHFQYVIQSKAIDGVLFFAKNSRWRFPITLVNQLFFNIFEQILSVLFHKRRYETRNRI